mmetsp:Transcript_36908/g.86197  ORF Transcript_36908/g.86197 Transcript_36908/m.86197 type:complete len:180 (-) Transcript_36908:269-808(-)|eukprot:CAMPEP_0113312614 /NCGR_PEP_ID=MMETSP0010_2-20120614/9380_1 /TAXON_ID=216773 ORGANISM="Corethron hystrix, Strain 308" /NCGR_SAMPLE_ID=MMETSP0010_2 /ASSEMBLY_ACC=CAM_ASM_000155 /LENGTH=179 /DNA_ID=CAMNT_0000168487 /DNA_START=192 /DNA_END=731 /DNA_ORIENTATION=- /assembly_acc=CAM_ASM_000155
MSEITAVAPLSAPPGDSRPSAQPGDEAAKSGAAGVVSNAELIAMSKERPGDDYEEIREQDRYLPIANIARIMKNTLPENAKIAKDAKETVQECVSEFISFITSEASDKCMQEKRKTINGDDLLWAMSTLGFDKYVEPLKIYLVKYREAVKGERGGERGTTGDVTEGGGKRQKLNSEIDS